MATRNVTSTDMGTYVIHTWPDLDAGDDGTPVDVGGATHLMFQIIGGTSADLQGSMDGGTTWVDMPDLAGSALSDKTPGIYAAAVTPLLVRPAGVAGNNLKVILHATKAY